MKHYGEKDGQRCEWTEEERMVMNLEQPRDMHNYTSAGFAKVQAPAEVTKLLQDFWKENKDDEEAESWPKGNTYVNHWDVKTGRVSVDSEMADVIAEYVRPVIEAWTGEKLVMTSVYGIRVYKGGAVLAPHVDRLPLVSSCILNVAQDVDEDWPLEVIGHDGIATNVSSVPGDMVLCKYHEELRITMNC